MVLQMKGHEDKNLSLKNHLSELCHRGKGIVSTTKLKLINEHDFIEDEGIVFKVVKNRGRGEK